MSGQRKCVRTRIGCPDSMLRAPILKCDAVPTDEAALRQKYIGNPAILKLLGAKWVHIVKRVPLRIAPQAKPADTSKGPSHIIDR
jgi:hypothetical protein